MKLNTIFQFFSPVGYILAYLMNFPVLLSLVLFFLLFNAVSLTGDYGQLLQKSFLMYGVVALLFGALMGFQFYRVKLDKLKLKYGLISTLVFIVSSILFFILFYSSIGSLGDSAPVNNNPIFYNENFNFAWGHPLIIAFFEFLIFSGSAGILFMGAKKVMSKSALKYANFWVIVFMGLFFMTYHLITQDGNFVSLFITFLIGSFFAMLVWIDELGIFEGKNYFVYTIPIRISMHWMIDMFQLGLMTDVAFKLTGGLVGVA